MAMVLSFVFILVTFNAVQGTCSVNNDDVLSKLQRQIQHILDRQISYEIKLAEQQKIIDQQAIEISSLKRSIRRSDTIEESNGHIEETEHIRKNSTMSHLKREGMVKNSFVVPATFNKNSRRGLTYTKKGFIPRRSFDRKEVKDFQSPIDLHKRQAGAIAFSVYLSHDVDPGVNQIVKFDKIITNEGNGYNVHTGAFTCPEGGLYLLTYFVGERDVNGTWLNLKVNSINIIDAAVDTYHDSQDLQGGNTVILRLNTGDVVLIESLGGHVEGSDSIRLTSFSGVLLSI